MSDFDLSAMMATPLKPKVEIPNPFEPVNPVFVLFNGSRVPFTVKFLQSQVQGVVWQPVLDGNPGWEFYQQVHSVDADYWPMGCGLAFGHGVNKPWLEALIKRSDCLTRQWK